MLFRPQGSSESIPNHPHTHTHILSSFQPNRISYKLSLSCCECTRSHLVRPIDLQIAPQAWSNREMPERIVGDQHARDIIGSEEMGSQRRAGVLFEELVGMVEWSRDEGRKEGGSFEFKVRRVPVHPYTHTHISCVPSSSPRKSPFLPEPFSLRPPASSLVRPKTQMCRNRDIREGCRSERGKQVVDVH